MKLVFLVSSALLTCLSQHVTAQSTNNVRKREASAVALNETTSLSTNADDDAVPRPPTKLHHRLAARMRSLQQDDDLHVIIGFRNTIGRENIKASRRNASVYREFSSISAVATAISISSLNDLDHDDNIAYIEPDLVATSASEAVPPNILNIQGSEPGHYNQQLQATQVMAATMTTTTTKAVNSGACSDPDSFKIGIIDSGVDIFHRDLPCKTRPDNCVGQNFASTFGGDSWSTPLYEHGTHVMGTIGALGANDIGISGMIPDGNVCYLIGKALDSQGIGYVSDILSAIEWAAQKGAHVINISIVIAEYLQSTNQFFDDLYYKQNRIVVAAAGNNGAAGQYLYPAAYSSVISVGSVDDDLQRSWFSQVNNRVDLAAFGRNIISTIPLANAKSLPLAVVTLESDGSTVMGIYSENSFAFDDATSGRLVLCPKKGGTSACPGPGGHICLIERSTRVGYLGQARRCRDGLGVGIIIYQSSANESFGGTFASNTTSIPVVAVDNGTGQKLLSSYLGTTLTIETNNFGYGYKDGTSMAAPAVTGAIGAVWRGCRRCTNQQVEKCLKQTAKDLGPYGKDNAYGYGLVQTEPALNCLRTSARCC